MEDTHGPTHEPLEIHPLTPDRWDDLAALFGEGGDPRWCWCMFWRRRSRDFEGATVRQNRNDLRSLTETGSPPGLVAYRGGKAVGWVSLGPREDFERLERSRVLPRVDELPVWSIVCFVVSATVRGQGIGRALLTGAVNYARDQGALALEAYPVVTDGIRIHPNSAFTGTLPMFDRAGFRVLRMSESHSGGVVRAIVRLELG